MFSKKKYERMNTFWMKKKKKPYIWSYEFISVEDKGHSASTTDDLRLHILLCGPYYHTCPKIRTPIQLPYA